MTDLPVKLNGGVLLDAPDRFLVDRLLSIQDLNRHELLELSWDVGKRIEVQQENATREYLLLGAFATAFDDAGLWQYAIDPETGLGYSSMRAWLSANPRLDRTNVVTAMQTYRLYILTFDVPVADLLKIAPSKFIDLNPEINKIAQGMTAELAELPDAVEGVVLDEYSEVIYNESRGRVVDWLSQAEDMSRNDIRKARKGQDVWTVKAFRLDLRNPTGLINFMQEVWQRFKRGRLLVEVKQPPDWYEFWDDENGTEKA